LKYRGRKKGITGWGGLVTSFDDFDQFHQCEECDKCDESGGTNVGNVMNVGNVDGIDGREKIVTPPRGSSGSLARRRGNF